MSMHQNILQEIRRSERNIMTKQKDDPLTLSQLGGRSQVDKLVKVSKINSLFL